MDGLIALFIIIGIVNAVTSSSKKKKRKAEKRAFRAARRAQAGRTPPMAAAQTAGEFIPPREVAPRTEAARAVQPQAAAPHAEAARPAQPQVVAPERAPRPIEPVRDGEGRTSTQGESEAEHDEHRRQVRAEEARLRQAREVLRDSRAEYLRKLRTAVVMSEVLNKPVSLRPRTGLHR